MKYKKAQEVLPEEMIKMIQEYMDGGYLYIPRKVENKKSWGENSGVLNEASIKRIDEDKIVAMINPMITRKEEHYDTQDLQLKLFNMK